MKINLRTLPIAAAAAMLGMTGCTTVEDEPAVTSTTTETTEVTSVRRPMRASHSTTTHSVEVNRPATRSVVVEED